ncbi:AAA family ATPase [Stenotrophomonas maltophilia]|uniref:AAA family ATPase n=1 Tax=Stenotrophomonas maltophilia TaxID=40324 RepID=UPI0021C60BB3|nr:AAA family ATPase [Stenotrophomonas maltophilia]MCU1021735.1 AAA family ATPase [Stenotrophomonas maltophilia]
MLREFVKISNVGLLRDGVPATPANFDAVTLIYAENGRGKSTLANILRAVAQGDVQAVVGGKTIDSPDAPHVNLLCDVGGGNVPVVLQNGAWTGTAPEIFVFDPTFVEDNVFSGQEVRADQRQSLLKFALGTESVQLEREHQELTSLIGDQTRAMTDASRRLLAFGKQMPVDQFIALQDVPDADAQIAALRSRLEAAKNAAVFLQRQGPDALPQVEFDVDAFFNILSSTFQGIREDAKTLVQRHFELHEAPPGIEEWVTKGREFGLEHGCPYCGQSVEGAELIDAYDGYFNRAYDDFMAKVAVLSRGVETRFSDAKIDTYKATLDVNEARVRAWNDQLDIQPPSLKLEQVQRTLSSVRELAGELALQKQRRPLEAMGTPGQKATISQLLGEIRGQVERHNASVTDISGRITSFNRDLGAESAATITASISRLEAVIAKRAPEAGEAITEYTSAKAKRDELAAKKTEVKEKLDGLLPAILSQYEAHINAFLQKFGASFSVEKFTTSARGGTVRTEYGLKLRGHSVGLGSREEMHQSFRGVLSEGDKRTLALAFFFARLLAFGNQIRGKVVVLDDPVCSMDSNRRTRTIQAIADLAAAGAQLVVLSHDAYFLLAQRDVLAGPKYRKQAIVHEIRRAANDYSIIDSCDLDYLCQEPYIQRYGKVNAYLEGTYQGRLDEVADDLRPLVEGFFKRRFPAPLLRKEANLGQIIGDIEKASDDSPLALAKPALEKMRSLNDFSTRFHHDDMQLTPALTDAELKQFAKMALELIHGDTVIH